MPRPTTAGSPGEATTEGGYVVLVHPERLVVWRLDPPATPEATARWLDATTNAVFEPGSSRLSWR